MPKKTSQRPKQNLPYILLVGTAVVLFWRGVWGLLDILLFPDHEFSSYMASAVLGVLILIITHKIKAVLLKNA